jgi:GcrA cell cycle regulator
MMNKPHVWSHAEDDWVAKRLRDGATAAEIGAELGISRNAVVGRVGRNPELGKIGFSHHPVAERWPPAFVPLFPPSPPEPHDHAPRKLLLELNWRDCKYPVRHDPELLGHYLFCAAPVHAPGENYCGHHHRLCATPGRAPTRFGRRV